MLSEKTSREIFKDIDIDEGNQEELDRIIEEHAQAAADASLSASNKVMANIPINQLIQALEEAKTQSDYDKTGTEDIRDQWIKARKAAGGTKVPLIDGSVGTWTQEDEDKIMAIQLSATTVPTLPSMSGTFVPPRSGPGRPR